MEFLLDFIHVIESRNLSTSLRKRSMSLATSEGHHGCGWRRNKCCLNSFRSAISSTDNCTATALLALGNFASSLFIVRQQSHCHSGIAAHLARPEVASVTVGTRHEFYRDVLRKVYSAVWRAAAIAFALFLSHHMVTDWTHPHCFWFVSFHSASL